jgi:hypothetical protein
VRRGRAAHVRRDRARHARRAMVSSHQARYRERASDRGACAPRVRLLREPEGLTDNGPDQ